MIICIIESQFKEIEQIDTSFWQIFCQSAEQVLNQI